MRNSIYKKVAASVATFLFTAPLLAQTKPFAPKIQTPSTKEELVSKEKPVAEKPKEAEKSEPQVSANAPAPRRLRQHSFGVGLGETFLLGKYADYGQDKITMDLLYSYAASYSFDVLVNAHWSEHKDKSEKMRVMGLNAALKSRLFEFDNFSPYVLGGLGFYAPRAYRNVNGSNKWSEQKITFGANFGGGVDLRLNDEWTVGALGQLHWPFTAKQDNGPDVKGYYFKLLLTLAYSF
ncbi:MAG: porin family protein [Bacteriovoracaceae bacterium]|nr:porin family protein [Bacteriovoracaceae bacterium]